MAGLEGIDASSMEIIDALGARRFAYDEDDHIVRPILVPTSFVPVAVERPVDPDDPNGATERVVERARFGLPGFQGRIVTNARDDKLAAAPTWKALFGKPAHHCLAAVSYVVERDRATDTTYRIQRRDGAPLVLAGLCAVRHYSFSSTGNEYDDLGHVQVTAAANRFIGSIHERFVCELSTPEARDAWLAADGGQDALAALLGPAPDDAYEMVPISSGIWKRGEKPDDIAAPIGEPITFDPDKATGRSDADQSSLEGFG